MPTLAETIQRYTARYRSAVLGRSAVWLVLIAAGTFVLWWGLRQWFPDPRISALIPAALAGAGAGFTYWWAQRHWVTTRQSAASLDKALGLQNRLVTLEEFAQADPRPELYAQLEEDAQRALDPDRVPAPQVLDRTSLVLALILLLLMVLPVRGRSALQQLASLPKELQSKSQPPSSSDRSPDQQDQQQQQAQDQQESGGSGQQQAKGGESQQDQSQDGRQAKNDPSKSHQAKADAGTPDQPSGGDQKNQSPSGDQGKQQQAKGGQSASDQQPSGQQEGGRPSDQAGEQKGQGQQQAQGQQGGQQGGQTGQAQQQSAQGQSQGSGMQQQASADQQQTQQGGGAGQGMSQPTAQQEALRAEIQQLLKEVSGELKDLQRQLAQVQAEPIPNAGTESNPNLYEDAMQLDPLTGTPVPIAITPDTGKTSAPRKTEGVGEAGGEVSTDAPTSQSEDATLSDAPVDERAVNRQVVPPEYRDVFDRMNRPAEEPQTEDAP